MKKLFFVLTVFLLFAFVLAACAPAVVDTPASVIPTDVPPTSVPPTTVPPTAVPATEAPTIAPEPVAEAALKITGLVAQEMAWSEDEIKALTSIDVESANSKGETETYTGILLADLIGLAAPSADATTIVFVADDGFTSEAPLADVLACANCILSFRSKGGFSSVLPDFAKNLQVKGVIEMQIK